MSNKQLSTIIIGGGLSGLSYAYYLKKKSPDHPVIFLEKRSRLGGLIYTDTIETPLGICTVEYGPDSFLPKSSHILQLIDDLKLSDQLINVDSEYQRSHILNKGTLKATPKGFYLIAPKNILTFLKSPLLSWSGKLRALAEVFVSRSKNTDPSLEEFVVRRFGKELFDVMAQGMVSGIYTADPKKLSLKATLPLFTDLEQRYGSVLYGLMKKNSGVKSSGPRYGLFYSFKDGMSQLVDTLEKSLVKQGVIIHKNCEVKQIKKSDSVYQVIDKKGNSYNSENLALASALSSSQLLTQNLTQDLSDSLKSIRSASSAVAILIYKKNDVKALPNSAGFVVPSIEKRNIIACSFLNHKFSSRAPKDILICRVFMGGINNESLLKKSDADLMKIAHHELVSILRIDGKILSQSIQRWSNSMPQYEIGHHEKVKRIEDLKKEHPNITLLGNYTKGVGLSDVIKQHFT